MYGKMCFLYFLGKGDDTDLERRGSGAMDEDSSAPATSRLRCLWPWHFRHPASHARLASHATNASSVLEGQGSTTTTPGLSSDLEKVDETPSTTGRNDSSKSTMRETSLAYTLSSSAEISGVAPPSDVYRMDPVGEAEIRVLTENYQRALEGFHQRSQHHLEREEYGQPRTTASDPDRITVFSETIPIHHQSGQIAPQQRDAAPVELLLDDPRYGPSPRNGSLPHPTLGHPPAHASQAIVAPPAPRRPGLIHQPHSDDRGTTYSMPLTNITHSEYQDRENLRPPSWSGVLPWHPSMLQGPLDPSTLPVHPQDPNEREVPLVNHGVVRYDNLGPDERARVPDIRGGSVMEDEATEVRPTRAATTHSPSTPNATLGGARGPAVLLNPDPSSCTPESTVKAHRISTQTRRDADQNVGSRFSPPTTITTDGDSLNLGDEAIQQQRPTTTRTLSRDARLFPTDDDIPEQGRVSVPSGLVAAADNSSGSEYGSTDKASASRKVHVRTAFNSLTSRSRSSARRKGKKKERPVISSPKPLFGSTDVTFNIVDPAIASVRSPALYVQQPVFAHTRSEHTPQPENQRISVVQSDLTPSLQTMAPPSHPTLVHNLYSPVESNVASLTGTPSASTPLENDREGGLGGAAGSGVVGGPTPPSAQPSDRNQDDAGYPSRETTPRRKPQNTSPDAIPGHRKVRFYEGGSVARRLRARLARS